MTTMAGALVLDPAAIEQLPWRRMHGHREVFTRLLWQQGESLAGIIRLEPGEELPSHAHSHAEHHAWVLAGTGRMLDVALGPGSYVHVPAGLEHAVTDVGQDGLTMLYLFLTR